LRHGGGKTPGLGPVGISRRSLPLACRTEESNVRFSRESLIAVAGPMKVMMAGWGRQPGRFCYGPGRRPPPTIRAVGRAMGEVPVGGGGGFFFLIWKVCRRCKVFRAVEQVDVGVCRRATLIGHAARDPQRRRWDRESRLLEWNRCFHTRHRHRCWRRGGAGSDGRAVVA